MKYNDMKRFTLGFLLTVAAFAHGQTVKSDRPVARLMIVGVGLPPLDKRDPKGGWLKISPESTPPRELFRKPGSEEREAFKTKINVGFNLVDAGEKVPAGKSLSYKIAEGEQGNPYVSLPPLTAGGQYVALLLPTGTPATPWLGKPNVRLVRVDGGDFALASCMAINISSEASTIGIDGKEVTLEPGTHKVIPFPQVTSILSVSCDNASGNILRSNFRIRPTTRKAYIFFNQPARSSDTPPIGAFEIDLPPTPSIPSVPVPPNSQTD